MDLIERQAAIDAMKDTFKGTMVGTRVAVDAINRLPSAEPVIRCKDCKHYNAGYECLIEGYGIERDKDWFCADGERREDE